MDYISIKTYHPTANVILEIKQYKTVKFLNPLCRSSVPAIDTHFLPELMSGRVMVATYMNNLLCQASFNYHLLNILHYFLYWEDEVIEGNVPSNLSLVHVPHEFVDKTFSELFEQWATKGTISLGLYRSYNNDGDKNYYVFTCPPSDTQLKEDDRVYILSPLKKLDVETLANFATEVVE